MPHTAVQGGGNTKMLVPLLNLQVFVILCFWRRSNPFSPRMMQSCIFHSATLFPRVKTAALTCLRSLTLLSGRLSCYLSYFECPLSSGAAAEQGLSHHGISTILRGKGTPSSCPLSVHIQHFLSLKISPASPSQLKTPGPSM